MRSAHLSDVHLGFRAYPKTIDGRNAREVDVERAWFAAVDQIVAFKPGLVTIAGDAVHHPRVGVHAIKAWREGLRLLLESGAEVVVTAGNHDMPRTSDSMTPIVVPDDYDRLHIVTEVTTLDLLILGAGDVRVACFPFVTRTDETAFRLDYNPDADFNVLVMHAEVKGAEDGDRLPYFYGGDGAVLDVGREAERWDIIACGDYHEFTRLHPTRFAFYSGSLERTSSNIWQESAPKGWVAIDTDAGTMELREVSTRTTLDLHTEGEATAERVNSILSELPTYGSLEGVLLRLKVDGLPYEERNAIDWEAVRRIKERALHFKLDVRYVREAVDLGDRRDREGGLSLADEARAFLEGDPEDVRELTLEYLGVPR